GRTNAAPRRCARACDTRDAARRTQRRAPPAACGATPTVGGGNRTRGDVTPWYTPRMPVKPRTPRGVLELTPAQQISHQRMIDPIRHGFERFGFLPIETPAFELTEVLLTKEGGETEKQVYFVQSTGALDKPPGGKLPELALRFDLTVPLARYVAEHEA